MGCGGAECLHGPGSRTRGGMETGPPSHSQNSPTVPLPPAKWETPFDPHDTFQSKFYVSKGRSVKVPMMSFEDLAAPYFRDEALGCAVVELGYAGRHSALLVLPDRGRTRMVEAALLPDTLRRWGASLQMR